MNDPQERHPAADDWVRSEAFAWYTRTIHNVAIELYMHERTDDRYHEIVDHLRVALNGLRRMITPTADGWGCPRDWCPDERDRCVPCDENEFPLRLPNYDGFLPDHSPKEPLA